MHLLGRTCHLIKFTVIGSGNHCYYRLPARTYYTRYMELAIIMAFIQMNSASGSKNMLRLTKIFTLFLYEQILQIVITLVFIIFLVNVHIYPRSKLVLSSLIKDNGFFTYLLCAVFPEMVITTELALLLPHYVKGVLKSHIKEILSVLSV